MMKNIRFFLYGILIILSLMIWDAWQRDHPAVVTTPADVAVPEVDHRLLKHDRKELRKVSTQKPVRSVQAHLIHVTTDVL